MDTKELFDKSIIGLQDSFNSLFEKENELASSLKDVKNRINEISVATQEVETELPIVNKLSAFKEYDRQIVELNKKIEFLEKQNEKLKKKEEPKESKEEGYNSGNEQPPPNMPTASDSEKSEEESVDESVDESGEESEEELEGDEISVDGVDYWYVSDSDNYIYKFISEEEVDEMPCGTYINLKINLFD